MKLICAWCGNTIDRAGYGHALDPETSHGMCPTCSETLASQERGVSLERHIHSIPIPILLVDRNNVVVTMNTKAGEMLGGKLSTAKQLLGQVFDCAHYRRPEGCGRAIHCSGCAIRTSVAATFDTGKPQIQIPATLTTESPDKLSEAVLTITTVMSDGVVLLRVEQRAAAVGNEQ
jgi:hypothetical protein